MVAGGDMDRDSSKALSATSASTGISFAIWGAEAAAGKTLLESDIPPKSSSEPAPQPVIASDAKRMHSENKNLRMHAE